MTRLTAIALIAAASLGGCAAWQRDGITDRENVLSAAGFSVLPASTPQRQDMLAKLPPNRLSQLIQGDRVSYLFPDPVVCHCLYAGGQQQFAQYQLLRQQRAIADEQFTAAQINFNNGWDWGPWGGFGPWY